MKGDTGNMFGNVTAFHHYHINMRCTNFKKPDGTNFKQFNANQTQENQPWKLFHMSAPGQSISIACNNPQSIRIIARWFWHWVMSSKISAAFTGLKPLPCDEREKNNRKLCVNIESALQATTYKILHIKQKSGLSCFSENAVYWDGGLLLRSFRYRAGSGGGGGLQGGGSNSSPPSSKSTLHPDSSELQCFLASVISDKRNIRAARWRLKDFINSKPLRWGDYFAAQKVSTASPWRHFKSAHRNWRTSNMSSFV